MRQIFKRVIGNNLDAVLWSGVASGVIIERGCQIYKDRKEAEQLIALSSKQTNKERVFKP
jgi:hypothetical protein